jgi:asparagine synthase (glutamine-hydrolysing)
MCGIAGAPDLTGNRDFPAEWLRAMTVAIAHRGLDDEYFHREPGLAPIPFVLAQVIASCNLGCV